jgi:hypothetical protein
MELEGKQLLSVLKGYFNYGDPDLKPLDVFWFLLLPGILLILYLLYYGVTGFFKNRKQDEEFATLKEEDYELFESIRLQKGLEGYDRDFLLGLCEEFEVEAVKVLLDAERFEALAGLHKAKLEGSGLDYLQENSGVQLRRLKKKIFN